jgi:hypothetical protein
MLLYRVKLEQDTKMGKKNKRKKRSARSLTAAVNRSPEQMVQLAENALATALHCLRSLDCTPAQLQTATGRAVRAASLLKRATQAANGEGAAS